MFKFSTKIGVTALSILAVFAIYVPLAHSQGGPADFMVNCNQGDSIQDALDQASDGNRIKVVGGTCVENIVIKLDHLTLDGVGNPTIDGSGDPASHTVRVRATNVTITGFTITGGRHGVNLGLGSSATINDTTVTGAGNNGIQISQSSGAVIKDCTVTNSGKHGISILLGSGVDIRDCYITNSDRNGIKVSRTSSAFIRDSTISGNGTGGIHVRHESHAQIDNNTITGNGDDGVSVIWNSSIDLSNNANANIINGNSGDGVACGDISTVRVGAVQDFTGGNDGSNTSIAGFPSCNLINSAGDGEF